MIAENVAVCVRDSLSNCVARLVSALSAGAKGTRQVRWGVRKAGGAKQGQAFRRGISRRLVGNNSRRYLYNVFLHAVLDHQSYLRHICCCFGLLRLNLVGQAETANLTVNLADGSLR